MKSGSSLSINETTSNSTKCGLVTGKEVVTEMSKASSSKISMTAPNVNSSDRSLSKNIKESSQKNSKGNSSSKQ